MVHIKKVDIFGFKSFGFKNTSVNFEPGLVGGHCISVDPYYLTYRSKLEGYDPKIILAGRKVNDSMGKFISEEILQLIKNSPVKKNNALILGISFKEDCPDFRNTKVSINKDQINIIRSKIK